MERAGRWFIWFNPSIIWKEITPLMAKWDFSHHVPRLCLLLSEPFVSFHFRAFHNNMGAVHSNMSKNEWAFETESDRPIRALILFLFFFCCILSSAAFLKMRTVQNESFVSIRQKRERIQILQTNTSIHLDEFYIFESVVLLKIRTM